MPALSQTNQSFSRFVEDRLHQQAPVHFPFNTNGDLRKISAVLFLLGTASNGEPQLILNKRSQLVRQPGDLCCPGGGISSYLDFLLARSLKFPATPLTRWPHATWWRRNRRTDLMKMALLLATALREGFEEMRLNPFGVKFLGPMHAQQMVLFKRAIYPLVGWVKRQRRFFPNWEVEKVVRIPLSTLLSDGNYIRCRISFAQGTQDVQNLSQREMPCFIHRHHGQEELLWGATYQITAQFLKTTFDYVPPLMESLPVVHRRLDQHYLEGGMTQ